MEEDASAPRNYKIAVSVILVLLLAILLFSILSGPLGISRSSTFPGLTITTEEISNGEGIKSCTNSSTQESSINAKVLNTNSSRADYDLQSWLTLDQNYTSLVFEVDAIPQNDTYGYGPSLMVNGLTDKGYWYQVGLAYDWWNLGGMGHDGGFDMFYQVWNSTSGKAVYPFANGSTTPIHLPQVQPGDGVLLSLYFLEKTIFMKLQDLQASMTWTESYSALNASRFIGGTQNKGFPTSLLVEWPHVVPYTCLPQMDKFSLVNGDISKGWLSIDEWNFSGTTPADEFNSSRPNAFVFGTPDQSFRIPSGSYLVSITYLEFVEAVTTDSYEA